MTVSFERVDKSALRELLRAPAPVAAVYAGAAPAVANEYQLEWSTRWGPLAEGLRQHGADHATIDALEAAVRALVATRAARGGTELAAFAAGGRLLATFPAPGGDWPDTVLVSAPTHVYPLLEWAQLRPAYVDVVVDRAGGEVRGYPGAGAAALVSRVDGPDDEIERNSPGGFLA